jgi:glycolate oxidase FAD binding subunit
VTSALASSISSRFENIVGNEFVRTETDALRDYALDGMIPAAAVLPENAEQTAEIVKVALQQKFVVIPCGARSACSIAMPAARYDVALDMTRVQQIAHYDPGDLTISVDAGMRLSELAKILAEKNQFLPLAIPCFESATVGGAIASGLDSPLRHFYGTARDFLIGAEFVDGTGSLAKSGGRVVKNVTGYDFHKLLNGSLGSLAVITRLNFRTFPVPLARRGFLASFADEGHALAFMKELASSPLTPTLVETLSPEFAELFLEEKSPVASLRLDVQAWTVCVGFEGSNEVCERYARDLGQLARIASAQNAMSLHDSQFPSLFEILRDGPISMRHAAPNAVVFRFATLPSKLADLLRGLRSFASSSWLPSAVLIRSGSILYFALLPREADDSTTKQIGYFWKSVGSLRAQLEFTARVLFCPTNWKSELTTSADLLDSYDLQRRVKKAFDPNGVFASGRFLEGI